MHRGQSTSISIYHNGGTGNLILAIYSNVTDAPGSRLAISLSTPINATADGKNLI
ncbi:MAG: hypothetical protein IPF54_22160 [Draconibacterium sp.]|nr:hypothetical protein [Draconibacterium sp.]